MEISLIRITEKMMEDEDTAAALASVLPEGFDPADQDLIAAAALADDMPAGAVCLRDDDRARITWIYTEPEFRRQGIAGQLMEFARSAALREFISPELIAEIELDDSLQSDLLGFFDSIEDAEIDVTGCFYEASPEVIRDTVEKKDLFKKAVSAGTEEMDTLPDAELLRFLEQPDIEDIFEISDVEVWKKNAARDLCFFSKKNKAISNIIMTSRTGENTLSLDLIYSRDPAKMGEMIAAFGNRLVSEYPGCSLVMRPVNEQAFRIMEHLFSEVKVCGYVCEVSLL